MFSRSLLLRLVIPLGCVLIVYGGFHTYLAVQTQREEILAEATLSTLRLADTIRRSTRHAMLQSRREDVHKMIEDIGKQEGIHHVRIFNKQGRIMYSSNQSEINHIVNQKEEACLQCHDAEKPLTKLDTSKRTRDFRTGQGDRTLAAIEVIRNEPSCWNASCHAHAKTKDLLGVVDVGVSLEQADHRVTQTTRKVVAFGVVSTAVICGLVALFIRRFVSRPVQRLLECTHRIAQGDLNCQIQVTGYDELGRLARSFTRMTEDLRKARAKIGSWTRTLEEEVGNKTRDLQLAQAQVVHSEKLSSIGLLAAGVAHELNSPLTGILTFAHLLAKRMPDDSSERQDLQVIITQTERCAKIIRQLLDFSRESSHERKLQDLHEIIEKALALVAHQSLFHDIKIECDFDLELPEVLMDADQMQQVFLNLLVNAGEAMPAGGPLIIETRGEILSARPESTADADTCGKVQIVLRDTGIGIPPESLDKVFDPFFTSKDVGEGTGLGLAVSYGIIERHGGTITVQSTLGEGTTMTITLPCGGPEEESV